MHLLVENYSDSNMMNPMTNKGFTMSVGWMTKANRVYQRATTSNIQILVMLYDGSPESLDITTSFNTSSTSILSVPLHVDDSKGLRVTLPSSVLWKSFNNLTLSLVFPYR